MKERWDDKTSRIITSDAIDKFVREIELVCKKHGLSISHQDGHGAFIIEDFYPDNISWLKNASRGAHCTADFKRIKELDD